MDAMFIMMPIFGIGVLIILSLWRIFAREKFRKSLLDEVTKRKSTVDISNRPKTLQQYILNPDLETYIHYLRLLDEFERLVPMEIIDVTSLEMEKIKYSVSALWYKLWVKRANKHKIRIFLTVMISLLLLLPGCIFLLQWSDGSFSPNLILAILLAIAIFTYFVEVQQSKNFTRFESMINKYYSFYPETAKEDSKSSELSRLFELDRLWRQGVITKEEFTKFKARLLNPS